MLLHLVSSKTNQPHSQILCHGVHSGNDIPYVPYKAVPCGEVDMGTQWKMNPISLFFTAMSARKLRASKGSVVKFIAKSLVEQHLSPHLISVIKHMFYRIYHWFYQPAEYPVAKYSGGTMPLACLQLFKIYLMKPVWALCYCLGKWESYACATCAPRLNSHSRKSLVIWRCYVKAVYCWIVSRGSGFTIVYLRICLLGRLRLLSRLG